MIHAFANIEIDDELFELRRDGSVVKVEPKVFDLIVHLLRHRDRVVLKDELLDAVWPGQAVSESVLPKCVTAARKAIGDDTAAAKAIQTVHGRGYRFAANVRTREQAATNAPQPAPASGSVAPRHALPFIGRHKTLARLRAILDDALSERGSICLLAGEPGIGKTRTAEELAAMARDRGATVLIGRSHEGEGAPAFWPWSQILSAALRAVPEASLRRALGSGASDLAELLPGRAGAGLAGVASTAGGEQARFRLFDSIAGFLTRLARQHPVVLILDDLHWADDASLHLLRFLARDLPTTGLLIVATYRDADVRREHPLSDLLGALAREPVCQRLTLRGFDEPETIALIESIAGARPEPALAEAVQEMSEGNPFFIQEISRLFAEGGIDTDAASSLPLALPQSVRDAIGRRLNVASPACNRILRAASVIGREFGVALLARVCEEQRNVVLELLAEARAGGLLDEGREAPGRFRFHHALVRQTLYEELSMPERVRLHGRVGEALTEMHGAADDTAVEEIAHHFFQSAGGAESERAVQACVRAAERAYALLAYEQSARHYERALAALDMVDSMHSAGRDTRRCELLLALAESRSASGAREQARAAVEGAASLARHLGRIDLLAGAAISYRGRAEMGTPPETATLALLEEARSALESASYEGGGAHAALLARLLSRLAGTPPYADSMQTREELSGRALELARSSGDLAALRDALSSRLWACLGPDRIAERFALADEILALAARQNDAELALLGHEARLGASLLRGDMETADRALTSYCHVAEQLRQPAYLFMATFLRGSRAMARGELDRAEGYFRAALERGRGTLPYAHFLCAGQMYPIVYMRGGEDDPELARIFFGEMMALPYSWEPAVRSALAFSGAVRGEPELARREFEAQAARGFANLRRDEHWLVTLTTLSSVSVVLGDRTRAAELYDLMLPYADLVVVHDLLRSIGPSVASILGNLATTLGRFEEGASHFERALARETDMGATTSLWDTKPAYARLLLSRGGPGDRDKARAFLGEAEADMRAHGATRSWTWLLLDRDAI